MPGQSELEVQSHQETPSQGFTITFGIRIIQVLDYDWGIRKLRNDVLLLVIQYLDRVIIRSTVEQEITLPSIDVSNPTKQHLTSSTSLGQPPVMYVP